MNKHFVPTPQGGVYTEDEYLRLQQGLPPKEKPPLPQEQRGSLLQEMLTKGESLMKRDLLDGLSAKERKAYPLYSGVIGYFRDALLRVAKVSWVGNEQHNPGEPLHWARGKSMDQMDCVARHMAEVDEEDPSEETEVALASQAWRSLAALQIYLEKKYSIKPPPSCK